MAFAIPRPRRDDGLCDTSRILICLLERHGKVLFEHLLEIRPVLLTLALTILRKHPRFHSFNE